MESKLIKEKVLVSPAIYEEKDVRKYKVEYAGHLGRVPLWIEDEEYAEVLQKIADGVKSFRIDVEGYTFKQTVIPDSIKELVRDTTDKFKWYWLDLENVTNYSVGSVNALLNHNNKVYLDTTDDSSVELSIEGLEELSKQARQNIESCNEPNN